MPLARRIIFYIFVALYLVVCPVVVLYTLGIILNPKEGEWVRTGLIHFSTIPEGASVYLGKSRFIQPTPTVIQDLIPGRYNIAIRQKGYKTWEHTVWLDAGKAISFDNIMLIPNNWKSRQLSREKFTQMYPLENTDLILACKSQSLGDCLVYDRKKEKALPLLSYGSKFHDFPVISVFTAKKSNFIVFYGGSLWDRKYLFMDLGDEEGLDISDITKFFPARPVDIIWEPGKDKVLFAVYKEHINRLDVGSGIFYPHFVKNITGYGLHGKRLYYMDKDLVWTKHGIIFGAKTLHTDGVDIEKCFLSKDGHRVIFKDGEMIYVLEIEPQGKNHIDWVTKVKNGTNADYAQETGYLYYLSEKDGFLSRIHL